MAVDVVVKKWGNSLGFIVPKDVVKKRNLKKGDKVKIEFVNGRDLSDLFGSVDAKVSGQEFKDLARGGWG